MSYTTEQVVNGIIKYADNEVMGKLPTSGKWVVGTAIGLASRKAPIVVKELQDNTIVKMLGIFNEDGTIDVDVLVKELKDNATKYGKLTLEVPMIGQLTFSASDVDVMRSYIQ